MAYQQCLSVIREATGVGDTTDAEAQEMLDAVLAAKEKIINSRRLAGGDALLQAAAEVAERKRIAAARARIDALNNAAIRKEALARVKDEAEGRIASRVPAIGRWLGAHAPDLADGISSINHWVARAKNKLNVEGMWIGRERQQKALIENELRQAGVYRQALSGVLDREVAQVRWRLKGGAPDTTMKISPEAQKWGEIFHKYAESTTDRLNREAGQKIIGDAADYVAETHWDGRDLRLAAGRGASRDAAFTAWLDKDLPRMAESSFDDVVPREGETELEAKARFLHGLYDGRVTGVRRRAPPGIAPDEAGYIPAAFEGTHNIAREYGHARVIRWKDSNAWYDHQQEFGGGGTLLHQLMNVIGNGERNAALMHYWGTNPEANFNQVIQKLREEIRDRPDDLEHFNAQVPRLQNTMGRLTGRLNSPMNDDRTWLNNSFENLMHLEAMAHLGGVQTTHFSAAPGTFSAELAKHGVNRLAAIAYQMRAVVSGRGGAELRDIAADSGAYAHGWANALHRTQPWTEHGLPGFASRAAAEFVRTTGINALLDRLQFHGVKGVLMSRLGRGLEAPLADMEQHQQALVRRYGIDDDAWKLLQATERTVVEGRPYLTPSDALDTDPAAVEALLRQRGTINDKTAAATVARRVEDYQIDLGDEILMYLNDAADHGAVRPGVREQGIALGETRPGTFSYMTRRALAQFKMWPLAALHQIIGREIGLSQTAGQAAWGLGATLSLLTLGGAARISINDAVHGRPQRDWSSPSSWIAAFAQGGGLGIWGDFLFGEVNRLGATALGTLGGPIGTDADRLSQMFGRFKADLRDPGIGWTKAFNHAWVDLVHWGIGHVPFGNLIYLKGALDYLLWYHIYDTISPGWWARTNQRLIREQGRPMLGYVPGGGVPWGVPPLYMQRGSTTMGLLGAGR